MFTTFIKAERIAFNNATYQVRYFKHQNWEGVTSYSLEVQLHPDDTLVIDAPSIERLRQKFRDILPAALYSRMVVAMR
ncbi:MAG: hypothetical protein HY208_06610 [Nitrospirae bacterium]|nr:hypothetical protein [Nitrospirota bacterium]